MLAMAVILLRLTAPAGSPAPWGRQQPKSLHRDHTGTFCIPGVSNACAAQQSRQVGHSALKGASGSPRMACLGVQNARHLPPRTRLVAYWTIWLIMQDNRTAFKRCGPAARTTPFKA